MRAFHNNGTWEVIDLPNDKKVVGSKWVFTVIYKVDGEVEMYKARLVAQGFTQTYGVDKCIFFIYFTINFSIFFLFWS